MLVRILGPITVAVLLISPAAAQDSRALLKLPELAPCGRTLHPRLPEKWRGAYLMAPFTKAQLVLAEITSDAALSAMRLKHQLNSNCQRPWQRFTELRDYSVSYPRPAPPQ